MRFWMAICLGLAATTASGEESDGASGLYSKVIGKAISREGGEIRDGVTIREDRSSWENAWEVRTKYFVVKTTHSRALGLDIGTSMDQMFVHFQELTDSDFEPSEPLQIYIFPTLAAYNKFGDDHGADHSSLYGSFYSYSEGSVGTYYIENRPHLKMWITHSVVHQFLHRVFPRSLPLWVDEGLASYFSFYWSWEYGAQKHKEIAESMRWVSLRRLMTTNIEDYKSNAHERFMQLGMLINYLLWHKEETKTVRDEDGRIVKEPFADYLRVLLNGGNASGLAIHKFLSTERVELEREFRAYRF